MLSSRGTSHHKMVKGIKTANHEHLVVTRKISVESDRLEIDVPSTRSGMDPNVRQKVLPGRSVVVDPILSRYSVQFYTAVVPKQQLWRLHWPLSVQIVGDLSSKASYVLNVWFHGDAAAILGPHQLSGWRRPERCISSSRASLPARILKVPTVKCSIRRRVFRNYWITTEPRCELYVLLTSHNKP